MAVKQSARPRIRFSVIGINHSHINGQVNSILRGGGELVSLHAVEDDLATAFMKTFPQVKRVQAEKGNIRTEVLWLNQTCIDRLGYGPRFAQPKAP